MYTCEIKRESTNRFRFECLDSRGYPILRSADLDSREEALTKLSCYLNPDSTDYIFEFCEDEDCHYFKITLDGFVLLESRSFDNKKTAYDFMVEMKSGCKISHIIDKSFEDACYYLSCTSRLQFRSLLKVELEKDDDQFVGSIPELNIFAYSNDLNEVIDEIKLDLDDLFNDLFVEHHTLSSRAKSIKDIFKSKLQLDAVS